MTWSVLFTKHAQKDAKKVGKSTLKPQVEALLKILEGNPLLPPFKALVGDLKGVYSRRINIQDRLVYQVYEEERIVKILRMWTHYDG